MKQEIPIKILIRDFDYKNDEVLFNFYCSSIEEAEAVFSSILKGVVRHKKITRHHYFTDDSVFEGRCWVQFDEKINDELCFFNYSIDFLGKEHKYIKYSLIKSFYKKRKYKFDYSKKYDNCWLVMDRDDQADDNAEHFYRYLKELENFDKKVYFCLKSSSHDWARLQDEGFSLIDYGTEEYERALNAADKIISSHAAAFVFDYFRDKRLFQKDLVFLQHGVIYNDLSTLFEPEWKKIKLFVTSATDEYKSLVGDGGAYRYTSKEVVLTGLPRHDSLLAKYENYKSTSELSAQRILIMPTWRPYLLGAVKTGTERELLENFESTEYFKAWMSFLKSESLKNLSDSGVIIEFFPHANIQPYIELFDIPEHVQLMTFSNVSIQDLFVRASLMITDYSSVAFEMAYLQKPVIYYQFDVDDFYRKGVYNKGYFDSKDNGFGPVVYEEADLLYEVEQLHMAQFQLSGAYKERVEKFFPYRDGKCCERLLSEILKRDFYKNTEDTDKSTVLNSMLKKGLFRNALNLLKNNQLEQYSSLKSFLLWRLDGVLPEFTEDDGYKRAYDFDKHLISFDLEKCIKFKINESNLTIGEQIFVDEIKEYKKSISRFLECNEPIANFIEAPYFFRRFINLYFNLNFLYFFKENFVDFTKFKSVSKFLSNDLNIYSQFSKCLKSKKTSLEFELYIEKGEFNSRPLKILRELWVEGKKLNEISVSDCDLDISSLRMCDYFMSRIEKNRLSSFN